MAPPWSNKVSPKGAKRSSKLTKNRPRGVFRGFGYIALTLKRFPCFGGSRGSKINSFPVRRAYKKIVLILICFLHAFSLMNLFFLCFYRKWVKILTRRGWGESPFGRCFSDRGAFWAHLGPLGLHMGAPSTQSHQKPPPGIQNHRITSKIMPK